MSENVIREYLLDCLRGSVLDSVFSSKNRPKITHFSRKIILTSKTLVEGFLYKNNIVLLVFGIIAILCIKRTFSTRGYRKAKYLVKSKPE